MAKSQKVTAWRKLRIDLLTDEDFGIIEDQLPPELATAPYMFYLAALKKADDDGAFDLEDGEVFSRLMRIGNTRDVFTIANLMMQRRIITRVGESTLCLIVDWDYAPNEVPRSLEQRRTQVKWKIEQAEKLAASRQFEINRKKQDFEEPSFFSFENDKNEENVTKNFYGDKNAENVASPRKKEEIEIERIEKKDTHTHTEERLEEREKKEPPEKDQRERSFSSGRENEKKETPDTGEKTESSQNGPEAGEQAGPEDLEKWQGKSVSSSPVEVLNVFFAKNCKGYNPITYEKDVAVLAKRFSDLADDRNPPDIVATVFCSQFLKLAESGYYKDIPLFPDYMIKPAIYKHLLAQVQKILFKPPTSNPWLASWKKELAVEETTDQGGDIFRREYEKYGINPDSPGAWPRLQAAKKAAGGEPP